MTIIQKVLTAAVFTMAVGCTAGSAGTVSGNATFTGGIFGSFSIHYDSDTPDVLLNQVNINLGPSRFFDTTSAAPGFSLWQDLDVNGSTAATTGYTGADPATASSRNGATKLSLFFSDFNPGESFLFSIDVDKSAVCGGGILAQIACRTAASLTSGNDFAGSTIEFIFSGPNGQETTLPAALFVDEGGIHAAASFEGDVTATPEPASLLLMGAGLTALGIAQRRRSRA